MARWLTTALLIGLPCFLALLAYDAIAILVFERGAHPLIPAHDLSEGALQDLGLTLLYMAIITPRVSGLVQSFPTLARRACLIMLGLGLAWYEVLCAAASRALSEPLGLLMSAVVLIVVPLLAAPWYVRWLRSRITTA